MRSVLCNNHFAVQWGGSEVGFMEVSGLGMELDVVPHRVGSSNESQNALLPGSRMFSPVVLRRGIVKGDNGFFEWINGAQFHAVERRDVTIQLLDEQHNPVVIWTLRNAFPARLDYAPLVAQGSEVAVESLTLVHEGLNVRHTN